MHTTRNQTGNKNIKLYVIDLLCTFPLKGFFLVYISGFFFFFFFYPGRKGILSKMEFLIKATKQNLSLLKTSKLKNLVLGKSCFLD